MKYVLVQNTKLTRREALIYTKLNVLANLKCITYILPQLKNGRFLAVAEHPSNPNPSKGYTLGDGNCGQYNTGASTMGLHSLSGVLTTTTSNTGTSPAYISLSGSSIIGPGFYGGSYSEPPITEITDIKDKLKDVPCVIMEMGIRGMYY